MPSRRSILGALGGALLLASSGSFAQAASSPDAAAPLKGLPSPGTSVSATGTVIVELANFHCDRSRRVNDHFGRLKTAAQAAGMDLRFAPVAWKGDSIWPDRVYYATRDLYPAAEELVRETLFDGIQREGMGFEDIAQVMAYLDRRQIAARALDLDGTFSLAKVADRAANDDVLYSEMKAGRLVDLSAATEVPIFLWLKDGEVVKAVSAKPGTDPLDLVQQVQGAISGGAATN